MPNRGYREKCFAAGWAAFRSQLAKLPILRRFGYIWAASSHVATLPAVGIAVTMGQISLSNRWSLDMSIRLPRHVAIIACMFVAVTARVADGQPSVTTPRPVQVKLLLPSPPSVGSDEYTAEIDEMLTMQAARTESQIKQFHSQESLGLAIFKDIMPELGTPQNLPKLKKLYKTVKDAAAADRSIPARTTSSGCGPFARTAASSRWVRTIRNSLTPAVTLRGDIFTPRSWRKSIPKRPMP